jgi:hypothetical protein
MAHCREIEAANQLAVVDPGRGPYALIPALARLDHGPVFRGRHP